MSALRKVDIEPRLARNSAMLALLSRLGFDANPVTPELIAARTSLITNLKARAGEDAMAIAYGMNVVADAVVADAKDLSAGPSVPIVWDQPLELLDGTPVRLLVGPGRGWQQALHMKEEGPWSMIEREDGVPLNFGDAFVADYKPYWPIRQKDGAPWRDEERGCLGPVVRNRVAIDWSKPLETVFGDEVVVVGKITAKRAPALHHHYGPRTALRGAYEVAFPAGTSGSGQGCLPAYAKLARPSVDGGVAYRADGVHVCDIWPRLRNKTAETERAPAEPGTIDWSKPIKFMNGVRAHLWSKKYAASFGMWLVGVMPGCGNFVTQNVAGVSSANRLTIYKNATIPCGDSFQVELDHHGRDVFGNQIVTNDIERKRKRK